MVTRALVATTLLFAFTALTLACSPPETENRFQKAVAENLCPEDPQPVMDMLSATEQEEHVWVVTKTTGDHAGAAWLVTDAEDNNWNFEAQNEEANAILNSPDPTCS